VVIGLPGLRSKPVKSPKKEECLQKIAESLNLTVGDLVLQYVSKMDIPVGILESSEDQNNV
jgi:hypothetical protein